MAPAASAGYSVVVSELLGAAKAHAQHGDNIAKLLATWRKAADLDPGAFGRMSISPKIAKTYKDFYDEVTADVTKAYLALYSGSIVLTLNALAYMQAEVQVTAYINQVAQDNKYLIGSNPAPKPSPAATTPAAG